jgi:hypothetical protein
MQGMQKNNYYDDNDALGILADTSHAGAAHVST